MNGVEKQLLVQVGTNIGEFEVVGCVEMVIVDEDKWVGGE